MAVGSDKAIPVENRGYHLVVADECQLPNGLHDVSASAWTGLPSPSPRRTELAVDSALPMNDEHDITTIDIDVDNNLLDEGADDALLQAYIRLGGIPCIGEVCAECPEAISVRLNQLRNLRPFDARFDLIRCL